MPLFLGSLPFPNFPFVMVVPRVLTRSIDIKLGFFLRVRRSLILRSLFGIFSQMRPFKVVTIQQCPNHIACGTFEEGGEAAKLDFEEQGSIRICGVECQVISPTPRWRRFSCIITPTRTMTVQCVGFCPIMARSTAFLTRRGLASRVSTRVPG